MNLTPLKYKTYSWSHNPETYTIVFDKDLVAHKYPGKGGAEIEDLATAHRVITGKGTFAGVGAYDEFRKLATVFYEDGAGPLIHPVWQISNAVFKKLQVTQEPTPDFVAYEFEFWEDTPALVESKAIVINDEQTPITEPSKSHTVVQGEYLNKIAKDYNTTLDSILAVNKDIKNPNKISIGQKINIPS